MYRHTALSIVLTGIAVLSGCSKEKTAAKDAAPPPAAAETERPIEPVGGVRSNSGTETIEMQSFEQVPSGERYTPPPAGGSPSGAAAGGSAASGAGSSSSYTAPSGSSGAVESSPSTGRMHVVQRGETLWTLAKRYYGNGREWRKIYAANRNRITNANDVPVGIKLIIP